MPIDPAQPFAAWSDEPVSSTALMRALARIAELERRVAVMERGNPVIQLGVGVPTPIPRNGTPYIDSVTDRFYVFYGGLWYYTTLTFDP